MSFHDRLRPDVQIPRRFCCRSSHDYSPRDAALELNILNTTEMRDKIYALLGVAPERDQLGIMPDYYKNLDLIFKETACALLRAGCIEVLVSASSQNKSLQLPSWVPDWSTDINGYFFRLYHADKGHSQAHHNRVITASSSV